MDLSLKRGPDRSLPSDFVSLKSWYGHSFEAKRVTVKGLCEVESSRRDEDVDVSYASYHFELILMSFEDFVKMAGRVCCPNEVHALGRSAK